MKGVKSNHLTPNIANLLKGTEFSKKIGNILFFGRKKGAKKFIQL